MIRQEQTVGFVSGTGDGPTIRFEIGPRLIVRLWFVMIHGGMIVGINFVKKENVRLVLWLYHIKS